MRVGMKAEAKATIAKKTANLNIINTNVRTSWKCKEIENDMITLPSISGVLV
jgi:hypothetical protein